MPTVYPMLKPFDWPNKALVEHIPLFEDIAQSPLIAFSFDAGSNYQFINKGQVNDVKALFGDALKNLAALDYPWEVNEIDGQVYATSSGKEFSAERVLDRNAMRECQRLLGSKKIVVAAPRRTCLFATAYDPSQEKVQKFLRLVNHTYRDDSYGHAPITPAFYVAEGGKLIAISFAAENIHASARTGVPGLAQTAQQQKLKHVVLSSKSGPPDGFAVSIAKLRVLQPQLFANAALQKGDTRIELRESITEQLQSCKCQPAVVIDANECIVAAYSDSFDCVALLKFDLYFARTNAWQSGTRLLTVNGYFDRDEDIANDLVLGPKHSANRGNFRPLIADLLTDDVDRLASRKALIPEDEWSRTQELGQKLLANKSVLPRDGRPLNCGKPIVANGPSSAFGNATARPVRGRRPARPVARFQWGTLTGALVFITLALLGMNHIGDMKIDGFTVVAFVGVLVFGIVGLVFAAKFYKALFPSKK